MRVKTSQMDLNSALTIVLRAVSLRSILPVLAGVRLVAESDKLHVSATDLEITMHCSIDTKTEQEGKAIIPGRVLGEAVKNLPESMVDLSVDQDLGQAVISCEKVNYTIKGLPIEDYPQLPEVGEDKALKVSGDDLSEAIRQVIKAVGKDEARPTLGGVLLSLKDGVLRMVATDSYRLAVKEVALDEKDQKFDVIVPVRAVEELGKLTGEKFIMFNVTETQIYATAAEISLISRLIEGQFPKYEQLLPEGWETRASFGREGLLAAIKRVSVISPNNAVVRMVVEDNCIKLNAFAQDVGSAEDEVECEREGNTVEIAFNAQYLIDGVTAVQGEKAVMEFTSPLKPAIIKAVDKEDYTYLIMPIRLS